ncbi:MAG TPA: ClpX C4-type zinc finger protein [Acidobacteriota bacterium]|nr:ClpX C4-type zinc finger protein [Acidobacteriota bacterium]
MDSGLDGYDEATACLVLRSLASQENPENKGLGRCSSCLEECDYVETIFAGPDDHHICDHNLRTAEQIIQSLGEERSATGLRCSFCSKAEGEVARLIARLDIYICSEYVKGFFAHNSFAQGYYPRSRDRGTNPVAGSL